MEGVDLMTVRYSHLSQSHKMNAVGAVGSVMDTIWTPKPDVKRIEKSIDVLTV